MLVPPMIVPIILIFIGKVSRTRTPQSGITPA
jgi:hypothetical protein